MLGYNAPSARTDIMASSSKACSPTDADMADVSSDSEGSSAFSTPRETPDRQPSKKDDSPSTKHPRPSRSESSVPPDKPNTLRYTRAVDRWTRYLSTLFQKQLASQGIKVVEYIVALCKNYDGPHCPVIIFLNVDCKVTQELVNFVEKGRQAIVAKGLASVVDPSGEAKADQHFRLRVRLQKARADGQMAFGDDEEEEPEKTESKKTAEELNDHVDPKIMIV